MSLPFSRTTRALQGDTPRRTWWLWGAALVGLAAWGLWFTAAGVTVYEVSRKARLEAAQAPHALAAQQAGALASTRLVIGRMVHAGEVLAELDTTGASLQWQEARAREQAVAPRIASLQAELAALAKAQAAEQRAAQAALAVARARLDEGAAGIGFAREHEKRLRAEARAGGVAEVDALRAGAETNRLAAGREALAADLHRLELDAATRVQQGRVQAEALRREIVAQEGELAAARAAGARLAQQIERLRVRAPVDGQVAEVQPLAPGAWVAEGQTLATIVPRGDLVVMADFEPAGALGRVRPGQLARLRLDGFPWAQYGSVPARVLRVAGEIREGGLRVELRPEPGSDAPLQHGLSGRVEVGIEEATPVRLLLRAAGQRLQGH